jgi:hypothetical protein
MYTADEPYEGNEGGVGDEVLGHFLSLPSELISFHFSALSHNGQSVFS